MGESSSVIDNKVITGGHGFSAMRALHCARWLAA